MIPKPRTFSFKITKTNREVDYVYCVAIDLHQAYLIVRKNYNLDKVINIEQTSNNEASTLIS